jgi:hypothetical protein
MELEPQSASFAIKSRAIAGKADVLAGEPSTDNVRKFNSVCDKSFTCKLLHVCIHWHGRPMFVEDLTGLRVYLTECNGFHSGPLKTQGEPTNTAEQV